MLVNRNRRTPTPIEVAPGLITGIVASPRAPGRFDLVIDAAPAARLGIQSIEKLRLRAGLQIDEELAARIAEEATICRVYDRAMMMLAARGRASGELKRLLTGKGEDPAVVGVVIEQLTAAGFLNDDAFARQFTRSRTATGTSKRRIQQELTRKGVDRQTASDAIAETFSEESVDETAAIERAAEKKLRTLTKVDDATKRRRLYGYLARRGFDADAISGVVARVGQANRGGSGDSEPGD